MKAQGIFLSWIVVSDIKAAIKFYTEVVGLELKEYHEEYKWAELSGPGGSTLGIGQEGPESPMKPGINAIMTIAVEDIERAKKHFIEKGASLVGDIVEIPHHVKMQTFTDSDGNTMQIVQKLS